MSHVWIFAALALASAPSAVVPQQRVAVFPTSFTIFFDRDATELTPEAIVVLDAVIDKLTDDHRLSVAIGGHGSGGEAMVASRRRAAVVRDYLVTRGIGPALITTTAHGASQPRAGGEGGERLNHRAEIRLMRMS